MGNNERTLDLSKRFDLSPARISQLRRELHIKCLCENASSGIAEALGSLLWRRP
jgi:hypothetical protein